MTLKDSQVINEPTGKDVANTIYHVGYDAAGKRIAFGAQTSFDALNDLRVMNTALNTVQAIQLRGVDIKPDVLYKLLVGVDYQPSALFIDDSKQQDALVTARGEVVRLQTELDKTLSKLDAAKVKVDAFTALDTILGSTQNASDTPVGISQDDATHSYVIAVGRSSTKDKIKGRTYHGSWLGEALRAAAEGEASKKDD